LQADSLFEAVVLAVTGQIGSLDGAVGPATVLDVDVREPSTRHSLSLQQVERWLEGATGSPLEASKKAKLKHADGQRIGAPRSRDSAGEPTNVARRVAVTP
jgi:hypothetical protein